ncbi:hypothetical protein V1524DRAFT_413720 [Lipomyces starkeyi]
MGLQRASDNGFSLDTVTDSETEAEASPMSDNTPTKDISHDGVTQHVDLDVGQCVPAPQATADTIHVIPNAPPHFRTVVPIADPPPNARIITFEESVQGKDYL